MYSFFSISPKLASVSNNSLKDFLGIYSRSMLYTQLVAIAAPEDKKTLPIVDVTECGVNNNPNNKNCVAEKIQEILSTAVPGSITYFLKGPLSCKQTNKKLKIEVRNRLLFWEI